MSHSQSSHRREGAFALVLVVGLGLCITVARGQAVESGTVSSGAAMDANAETIFNIGQPFVGFCTDGSVTLHAGVVPCLGEGVAYSIRWTGDGDHTSWHDPLNWNLNRVPEAGDDVYIPDVAATTEVVYSSASTSINRLICDEAFHLDYGALTIDDASELNGAFTVSGATLTGSGDVTVTDSLTWSSGWMSGSGTTTIASGASLSIEGAGVYLGRTIDNHGTADWISGPILFQGGTFNNKSDGVFNASAAEDTDYSSGGTFNNAGEFNQLSTGTTTFTDNVAFNNSGTVDIQAGTLWFFGVPYTQAAGATILNGGSVENTGTPLDMQGGMLTGEGTVTGDVVNSGGEVAPGLSPGVIDIDGNYTQTWSAPDTPGVLDVEIGGYVAGTEYDVLTIIGDATLGGVLSISLIDGFEPQLGDRFDVMTFDVRDGGFDRFAGLGIGNGLYFCPRYTNAGVTLTVSDTPSVPGDATPGGEGRELDRP